MGVFSDFFWKPSFSQAVELSIDELPEFLKGKTHSKRSEFEKTIICRLSEVKHLLNEVKEHQEFLQRLEPMQGMNEKLLKAFYSGKQEMISQLILIHKKLTVPYATNLSQIKGYCDEANLFLRKDLLPEMKSDKKITQTEFVLKESRLQFEKIISELNSIFDGLNSLFSDSMPLLTDFNSEIQLLKKQHKEIISRRFRLSYMEAQLSDSLKRFAELNQELNVLNASEEALRLNRVEEEIVKCNAELIELRNHAMSTFAIVEKPLRKMNNLAVNDVSILTKKQYLMLDSYLSDAFIALKTDVKAKKLRFLLNKLKELIQNNQIELTDKEKTISSVDKLLEVNFFDEFFWKENDLKVRIKELETRKLVFNVGDKMETKKNSLKITEQAISGITSNIGREKTSIQKLESDFAHLKLMLEQEIFKLTNQRIAIMVD